MKILIAYDGSQSSDAALADLVYAGLPAAGAALVVCVSEVWLPSTTETDYSDPAGRSKTVVAETDALAGHARKRVEKLLPEWTVEIESRNGSPATEILKKADEFDPDLIVVGAQGRSAIGRFALGSISQKVLAEARSAVRIGRSRIAVNHTPFRIMIGFDGSDGSFAAVNAVAARPWPADSEVRLVSVTERLVPAEISRFVAPVEHNDSRTDAAEAAWLENRAERALKTLGSSASFELIAGDPRRALIEEAARWNADCIFLGADEKGSRTKYSPLGSIAAAVAARASSSVEVVRARDAV